MSKLNEAIKFASDKHDGQIRKLTNLPYIFHPFEVAQIVATMTNDEDVICAALLHDTVEDTKTTLDEIADKFGLGKHDPLWSFNPIEKYTYNIIKLPVISISEFAGESESLAAKVT